MDHTMFYQMQILLCFVSKADEVCRITSRSLLYIVVEQISAAFYRLQISVINDLQQTSFPA